MTHDTDTPSDSTGDTHWQQETIDRAVERIESELAELQREASGPQREAVKRGRELVDELEAVLRSAASGDPPEDVPPYEESDAVDVSEQRKRP
jgi:hypothetical protein